MLVGILVSGIVAGLIGFMLFTALEVGIGLAVLGYVIVGLAGSGFYVRAMLLRGEDGRA